VRILFDADSLVYGCGFAAQKTVYDYVLSNEEGSELQEGIATSRDELAAVSSLLPEGWTIEHRTVAEAEPLENALALVKRQLFRVTDKLTQDGYDFERLELFLTGKGNFRDQIAQVRPYKGNRVNMEKPVHYKAIRRYLQNRWMAEVVNGWEADDEVAMLAASYDYSPSEVMIVSQDKDLRTVPGLLYNYRRNTYERITPREAEVNFYRQILVGDLTDNIVGCYRVGEAAANRLITPDMTSVEMYAVCVEQFKLSQAKKGCPYADRDPESVVLEFGRLLHMYRSAEETIFLWQPPKEK